MARKRASGERSTKESVPELKTTKETRIGYDGRRVIVESIPDGRGGFFEIVTQDTSDWEPGR